MALRKTVQTEFGFEVQNAYIRVEGVRVGKNKIQFQTRTSVDGVKPHFSDIGCECSYDIAGDNPIKQAYLHLKNLPEFAGAIDC